MNAETFSKGLEKRRLSTRLFGQNVENLDDYVEKLRTLSKRTVLECALVNLSDTKQGFTVPRGKQRCMEIGLCSIFIFLYKFIVFVYTTILFLSTPHDFFYSVRFEKLSLQNRWLIKKIMLTYEKLSLTTTIKRRNFGPVWDKPVPDRWLCFCTSFLSFCWSFLVASWEFTFPKICEESTV